MADPATLQLAELRKRLEQRTVPPVVLYHGDSPTFLKKALAITLEVRLSAKQRSLNSETLDGRATSPEEWLMHVRTADMFSVGRVVVVEDTDALFAIKSKKGKKDDEPGEPAQKSKVPFSSKKPLKGGRTTDSEGSKFGLKW